MNDAPPPSRPPVPDGPPTHRIVVDDPGLFTLYDGDQPGRHVFHMDNGREQIEVVTTLDALVVIACNMLALVADERPPVVTDYVLGCGRACSGHAHRS